MNEIIVFYSWQSDTDFKLNRYFIEECLKKAIKNLGKQIEISFVLDRDTKNTKGSPDIVSTIFNKIDECHLFIGDVSIVNSSTIANRKMPNPNVMIELGYAASKIGWDNIVCIFNSKYGNVTELPFDIKNRRVLNYNFDDAQNKSTEKRKLIQTFELILKEIDLDKIELNRTIKEAYKDEPDWIRKIAIERSRSNDYWEFELFSKLLDDRFQRLDYDLNRIERGLVLSKIKRMSSSNFISWTQDLQNNFINIVKVVGQVINSEIKMALGEPGIPGSPIHIKNACDSLYEALKSAVEIDIELKSIILTNQYMCEIKTLLEGWAKEMIEQIKILPREFEKIYKGLYKEGEDINISINIRPFESTEQILELLKKVENDISLLVDE